MRNNSQLVKTLGNITDSKDGISKEQKSNLTDKLHQALISRKPKDIKLLLMAKADVTTLLAKNCKTLYKALDSMNLNNEKSPSNEPLFMMMRQKKDIYSCPTVISLMHCIEALLGAVDPTNRDLKKFFHQFSLCAIMKRRGLDSEIIQFSIIKYLVEQQLIKVTEQEFEASKESKKSPLFFSIASGKYKIAQYLIQKKANPNAVGTDYAVPIKKLRDKKEPLTALQAIVRHINVRVPDVVEELLKNAADPNLNHTGSKANLPLLRVFDASRLNRKVISLLLTYRADPNSSTNNGLSVLQKIMPRAAKKSYMDVIKELLEHGADPNFRTKDTSSPEPLLVVMRDRTLLRGKPCAKGLVETLIKYNANPNVSDQKRYSALLFSLQPLGVRTDSFSRNNPKEHEYSLETTKKLLECKADILQDDFVPSEAEGAEYNYFPHSSVKSFADIFKDFSNIFRNQHQRQAVKGPIDRLRIDIINNFSVSFASVSSLLAQFTTGPIKIIMHYAYGGLPQILTEIEPYVPKKSNSICQTSGRTASWGKQERLSKKRRTASSKSWGKQERLSKKRRTALSS